MRHPLGNVGLMLNDTLFTLDGDALGEDEPRVCPWPWKCPHWWPGEVPTGGQVESTSGVTLSAKGCPA